MILFISFGLATFACALTYRLISPLPKLHKRLSPYDAVVKVRLNGNVSTMQNFSNLSNNSSNIFREFFRPMLEAIGNLVSKIASIDNREATELKLKRAGIDTPFEQYRASLIKKVAVGLGSGIIFGAAMGNLAAIPTLTTLFGFIIFSKSRGNLDRGIENRRIAIRSEMYTIDQLLALHIRTGSGVSQALSNVIERTNGIVSHEIADVLSRVRAGISIEESLYLASRITAEPHAARTYKLLAAASTRGVDLTQGLLDLAKDLRRTLREDIKATGAKRRAAMLLPTIGILAPIMLLFVSAPIPSIVMVGR
jgi:Flp pilus assembly protein TadB